MTLRSLTMPLLLSLFATPAVAIDTFHIGDTSVSLTGFYSLTAGKILDGSAKGINGRWQYERWNCPCTIQNWEYIGVYEKDKGWQTVPESLIGLQGKAKFSPDWSATVQVVSRGNNTNYHPYTPTVDWAYLSYTPAPHWTLQAGKKRIPLYYYSDYLYIGYAYPWVRPAPDVYGWPIYTYDGVNADYQTALGNSDWTLEANAWTGSYKQKNDAYDTLIYYSHNPFDPNNPNATSQPVVKAPTDESWNDIKGAYANIGNGIFSSRLMYMTFRDSIYVNDPTGPYTQASNLRTQIMGAAFNIDYDAIVVRSEFDRFIQTNPKNVYNYLLLGGGYRWSDYLLMYTYSHYMTEPNATPYQEGRYTRSLAFRWDFYRNTAFKVQYDFSHDESTYAWPFWGDSKLLSVSLQGTF